jgi:RNA polymerase sigma factor (sigma-70 family)
MPNTQLVDNTEITNKLFSEYSGEFLKYINTQVKCLEDCEDILNKTFSRFNRTYDRNITEPKTWLFRCFNFIKKDYYRTQYDDHLKNSRPRIHSFEHSYEFKRYLEDTLLCEDSSDINRLTENIDNTINLTPIINQLSKRQKDIIILHYYEDQTLVETREILKIGKTTLFKEKERALAELKSKMELKDYD